MSSRYKKILVPLDGSKYSEKALRRACDLVDVSDSELILIYVVEKLMPLNLLDRKEYLKMLRKFGAKTLEKANDVVRKKGISAKNFVEGGKYCR